VVDGGWSVIEIGVKLRDLLARHGLDLRIAEQIGVLGQGDDEGLVGEIHRYQGYFELLAGGSQFRVGPIHAGNGMIIGPGHGVLVLDFLRVDGRGRGLRQCGGGGRQKQQDNQMSHDNAMISDDTPAGQ